MALRLVGYSKVQGGFIDNVPGSHTFGRGYIRAGLDPASPLNDVAADITVDNSEVAEKNFNDATTRGARAALAVDLNDSWTLTAALMMQDVESNGVWDHDPTVGDLKVMRLMPDWNDDEWTQTSLKLEGEVFGGTLTATYGDLERDTRLMPTTRSTAITTCHTVTLSPTTTATCPTQVSVVTPESSTPTQRKSIEARTKFGSYLIKRRVCAIWLVTTVLRSTQRLIVIGTLWV